MLYLSTTRAITWPETPNGKEGQKLYKNFKDRVVNTISGFQRRIEKDFDSGTLYINPVERTFAFTGTSGGGENGAPRLGYNYDALVKEADALIEKNPDVEILKQQAGKPAIVMRFKN